MNLSPDVDRPVGNSHFIWETLKGKLKEKVTPVTYNNWFRALTDVKMDGDFLVVSVPNRFYADWITDYYIEALEREGSVLAKKPIKIRFQILENKAESSSNGKQVLRPPVQVKTSPGLNPKYTFDRFVVGSGNQLAHAASKAVADLPGSHYNPLFLYGGTGLGKTHLLNAIGIEAEKKSTGFKIVSLSAEKFMNEFINSVRNNQMEPFRRKFRTNCDMLLIDDIQFLGGKEGTQAEFFHTFNELYNTHRQIVVTSDKIPKEIPGLEERLRSRFEWGLIADIQPPDFETRVAILRKKADQDKIHLSDEVAMVLAKEIQSNVRELEGALIRLNAFASLAGGRITLDLAKEVIKNHFRSQTLEAQRRSSVESIQQTVAEFYQIQLPDLKSPRRLKTLAYPRQIAMYLCKKHLRLSFPELGQRFGGKDHTTVIHAYRKIELLLQSDPNLQNDIAILEKTIV